MCVGSGVQSKLNHAIFKQCVEIVRLYVDKVDDSELQVLFVLQTLLSQHQHWEGALFLQGTLLSEGMYVFLFKTLMNKGKLSMCTPFF